MDYSCVFNGTRYLQNLHVVGCIDTNAKTPAHEMEDGVD